MKTAEEITRIINTTLVVDNKGSVKYATEKIMALIKSACMEALKNASENAEFIAEHQFYEETIKDSVDNVGSHLVFIDKQSILNESNIPKL